VDAELPAAARQAVQKIPERLPAGAISVEAQSGAAVEVPGEDEDRALRALGRRTNALK
jgi:hypothetical protein